MQLTGLLFALCALFCQCCALHARDAHLTFPNSGKRGIMLGTIDAATKKLKEPIIINNVTDVLELNFAMSPSEKPSQVNILLGLPERNLEMSYEVQSTDNGKLIMYKFLIDVSTLPKALQYFSTVDNEPLTVSLILAEADNKSSNIFTPLFDISLASLDQVEYKKPIRFEAKPEIHHIFNPEPKTVSWGLAQVFILIIISVTFLLLISWMLSGAMNFHNLPSGFNFVYFLAFTGCIIGFEYIFAKYYYGSSIFETLFAALYLGIPSLLLGTKFLRNFGQTI